MNKLTSEEPRLIFFRETPTDLLKLPPLASSLQHLETSFLLISINRFPNAVVSCASAIESAMKAVLKIEPDEYLEFWPLKRRVQEVKEFRNFTNLSNDLIFNFKNHRNKINHYGFSSKDDEISAFHLLKTGFPLIEQCYKAFFHFSLTGSNEKLGGLMPSIARHFNVARKVFGKTRDEKNSTFCFAAFSHDIRWNIQNWMLSDWQKDILNSEDESGWMSWEFQMKQKEDLTSRIFKTSWEFDCPVCNNSESFVCELDEEKLRNKEIKINKGVCTTCGLIIYKNHPFLADELCKEQINSNINRILGEYGI